MGAQIIEVDIGDFMPVDLAAPATCASNAESDIVRSNHGPVLLPPPGRAAKHGPGRCGLTS